MKTFGKIASAVIVLLILIFSILSVSGYSYYFGDNKITVLKGINDLKLSDDLGGGVKFTIAPVTTDEVYFDGPMILDVIEERAALAGFSDYRIYVNDSTGNVELIIPNDVNTEYASVEFASFLICVGDVTIRPGSSFASYSVDSTGNGVFTDYYDTASEDLILDRVFIERAESVTRKEDGKKVHYLDIILNDEGKEYLSQITDPTANSDASYYNTTVSFWIDFRMIAYTTLTEHLTEGVISITDENFTSEKCDLYAAILNTDGIWSEVVGFEDADSDNVSLKMATVIAGALLIILAFVLIYRYRILGGITLVSLILQFSVMLAICTGFFANTGSIVLDLPAVCALLFTIMFTVFASVLPAERIRKNMSDETAFSPKSISDGFKSARTLILDLNVLFIIIAFVGFIMFGSTGFAVSLFGNAVADGIRKFSLILLVGSAVNFISACILPWFLAVNFKNFKIFAKPSMFGGKRND